MDKSNELRLTLLTVITPIVKYFIYVTTSFVDRNAYHILFNSVAFDTKFFL